MVVANSRPTKLTISKSALAHNILLVKKRAQANKIILAVKANAYGHGLLEVGSVAESIGVDFLGVATLDEASALREIGVELPILVMGIVLPKYANQMAQENIMATVSDGNWLKAAKRYLSGEKTLLVNVAVDTGMSRIGARTTKEIQTMLDMMTENAHLFNYKSIMTHFADSDANDTTYFNYQLQNWHQLTQHLPMPDMVHVANSGAAMYHASEVSTDIIRVGTVVYGMEPSNGEVLPDNYLQPVLGLESQLVYVKKMPAGVGISYGHHYITRHDEWIGTVPIGYGDGLPRNAEGFEVIIAGQKAKIVGQVAMDQLMVSLPHEFPVGTKVTFIGENGHLHNTLANFAKHVKLAPWEVTTGFQDRIKRELVD